jgi:hypothetical protein
MLVEIGGAGKVPTVLFEGNETVWGFFQDRGLLIKPQNISALYQNGEVIIIAEEYSLSVGAQNARIKEIKQGEKSNGKIYTEYVFAELLPAFLQTYNNSTEIFIAFETDEENLGRVHLSSGKIKKIDEQYVIKIDWDFTEKQPNINNKELTYFILP